MKASTGIINICLSILILLLVMPSSLFALEVMTDSHMKKTRGQAGVDVELDNIEIEGVRWEVNYVDDDGITGTTDDVGGVSIKAAYGLKTVRAVLDHTDRDGYLRREYGSVMRREDNKILEAYEAWKTLDPTLNIAPLEDWKETFPDAVEAAVLASGGDINSAPITIDVARKLELTCSFIAVNKRGEGLEKAQNFFEEFVALSLDYSGDMTANITAIMNATGMTETEAKNAYLAASGFAAVQADPGNTALADRVGTEVAYNNISIDGVIAKLPTAEIHKTSDSMTIGIFSEGAVNDGKEFLQLMTSQSTLTILGGRVEVTANH